MAGSVPGESPVSPRLVAVTLVADAQPQSIAPRAVGVIGAFWTFGDSTSVVPCASVGIPVDVPPKVAVITPTLVTVSPATYFVRYWAGGIQAKTVAASLTALAPPP